MKFSENLEKFCEVVDPKKVLAAKARKAVTEAALRGDERITLADVDDSIFKKGDVLAVKDLPVVIDGKRHVYNAYYVGFNFYESIDHQIIK